MNPRVKIITVIVIILLLLALIAGLYWSGFLLIFLLDLDDQVSLSWHTYWLYWQALDLPQFAPYALRIKIAGGMGFGMPLLAWLGLLFLLKPWSAWTSEDAYQPSHENDKPTPSGHTEQVASPEPPPDVPDQERLVQQMWLAEQKRRINEQRAARTPQTPIAASNQPINLMEDEDMNLKQMAVTAALAMAAVGATAAEHHKSTLPAYPRFNQNPQQIYELTLTVHDAPGPLEMFSPRTFYIPKNIGCVPQSVLDSDAYAHSTPGSFPVDVTLDDSSKTGNNTYTSLVALDMLVDEDYYGKGVCHWGVEYIHMAIWRPGDYMSSPHRRDVSFSSTLKRSDIEAGKTVTTYFLKSDYNDPEHQTLGEDDSVQQFTEQDYLKTPAAERAAKFFYITLTAKKRAPQPALQQLFRHLYRFSYKDYGDSPPKN